VLADEMIQVYNLSNPKFPKLLFQGLSYSATTSIVVENDYIFTTQNY
jgi:hypothetical protein